MSGKKQKNGEKIWLEGGRGGGVKIQENQAEVTCEWSSINVTFLAIKALPLILLFLLMF